MEECMRACGCPDNAEHRVDCPDVEPTWIQKRRAEQGLRVGPGYSREWDDLESHDPLTRDVAFNRHSMNDGDHVSPTDNGQVQVGTDNIRVALAQGINEDDFKRTLSAAVRATVGLDMTQTLPGDWERCEVQEKYNAWLEEEEDGEKPPGCDVHQNHRCVNTFSDVWEGQVPMEDWEEMLKGGLQTALETQTIVFAVGGVSRTATHQLVRSRRAAFHQQSQRAGYMGDAPEFRMPESVWLKPKVRQEWLRALMASWRAYRVACDADIAYQDARFILNEGTTNFILLEYPVREFLNVYAYRGCSMFQWEIVAVMRKCREVLVEAHPWLEPYIKISCEKTGPAMVSDPQAGDGNMPLIQVPHHCTFQGWEDVEGQCPFSWARHEARTFQPQFHRISRGKPQA